MMGRLKRDQGQFIYSFHLDEVVPADHRVREIADVLDLSWVHAWRTMFDDCQRHLDSQDRPPNPVAHDEDSAQDEQQP
jgi:hypothetical protein